MRPKSRLLFCFGLLLQILPTPSTAQCVDYADHLKWMGGSILFVPADAVAIQGDLAYIASSHGRLLVVDITDPNELTIVRNLFIANPLNNVAVQGDRTFVTTSTGLLMVETALPDSVIWETSGFVAVPYANGVALSPAGDYAFVSAGPNGLQVVDVPNTNTLQVVGGVDTPGAAFDVVLAGNYAYVADHVAGLQVVDISNPLAPTIVGNADPPGQAKTVAILGNLACLGDDSFGVHVIDISNAMSPSVLGWVDSPGFPKSIAMVGNHALLADQHAGVHAIDLTNPASPAIVGTVSMPDYPLDIRVAGDVAYVAHYANGLQLLDITHLTSPSVIGTFDTIGGAPDVAVAGNYAYMAAYYFFRIIDVSDPSNPSEAGSVLAPEMPYAVALSGSHAYLADFTGVQVVSITDPANPQIVGFVDTPGAARDVEIAGSLAYVAGGGLQVVDVSNPTAPALVGDGLALVGGGHLAVQGQLALMARGFYGLTAIDISTPSSPQVVATLDTLQGDTYAVVIDGDYAYTAQGSFSGKSAVYVIDISNPSSMAIVASVDLYGGTQNIAKHGNTLYARPGVRVIDVVDPAHPQFVGGMVTPVGSDGIAASDDYVFVVDTYGDLTIVPAQCEILTPVLFGRIDAVEETRGVLMRWDLEADEPISGFEVYRRDLPGEKNRRLNKGPLDPSSRSFRDADVLPGRSYEYFVVAVLPDGGRIQSQTALVKTRALELVMYQNHPNPFNPTTTISFVIPVRARARLTVFDVRGARVRVLVDENMPPGYREVPWDGRDDRGVAVASGVYFCELTAGKSTVTRKMMLLQ